jgi:hypothetical protein
MISLPRCLASVDLPIDSHPTIDINLPHEQ